jgi:transposase InsO family protein
MGWKAVPMDVKVSALFTQTDAGMVTVTEVCRRLGISRQTYYKYRRRVAEEGAAGLIERSRRPGVSPTRTSEPIVARIVSTRSLLEKEGWDNGAVSIFYRLLHDQEAAPSPRTIHRVLVRQGLVVPQPQKRPRSSYRRFQFPCTDDCWQIDGWEQRLSDGTVAVVLDIIDDCSRYLLHSYACDGETAANTWACMVEAIRRYGKPKLVLSDNSMAFTGRLRRGDPHDRDHRYEAAFEKNLRQLGVKPIHSAPKHPQTCGKNERSHQTVHRWLAARPTPSDLPALQTLLDEYRTLYNLRPHQALDGRNPLEQRTLSQRHTPTDSHPIPGPVRVTTPTASRYGSIKVGSTQVGLGAAYAHQPTIVFNTDNHLSIYYHEHLITQLTLDPTRTYHGLRHRGQRRAPRTPDPVT